MCFGDDRYVADCAVEFRKLVDLGAAGMLFDESQHHGPARACFDSAHGHRPGWPVYANDRAFIRRLRESAGAAAGEDVFLVAGEANYDWEMEAYQLAYYRTESKTHIPLQRYLLPGCQYMTAVTGFNDRNMLNQCLMFRFIVSYEPYNFKGSLDDYPDTMAYGAKMHALRAEHRKWFWDGEYLADGGFALRNRETGAACDTFGAFRAQDGSYGLVVCNYEDGAAAFEIAQAPQQQGGGASQQGGGVSQQGGGASAGAGGLGKWRLVDVDGWHPIDAPGGIAIPPRSAAICI